MEVDFTRFYTYEDGALNTSPDWSDEFDGSSLDFGKWYTANWTFAATRFRPQNVKVQDGRLYLRVNRGESFWNPSASVNTVNFAQNDSVSQSTLPLPDVQVAGNTANTDPVTVVAIEPLDAVITESGVSTHSAIFLTPTPVSYTHLTLPTIYSV